MASFLTLIFDWVQQHPYLGTIIFMAMESSILPVPSEVVIPPAAYIVGAQGGSVAGIVLAGTFGSWLGSAVMYWLSRFLGRAFIVRFGKFFGISADNLARAEHWLARYEAGGVFFARLLPVVRHLISIPAGIVRMGFGLFSVVTILGSALWCTVLAWYGHKVLGAYAEQNPGWAGDPAGVRKLITSQSHLLVAGVLILCALYFAFMKLTAKREPAAA